MIRCWLKQIFQCFSSDRTKSKVYEMKEEKISHVFSPPLNISMLRKVRCRRPRSFEKIFSNRNRSAMNYSRRKSSLIAINFNEDSTKSSSETSSFSSFETIEKSPSIIDRQQEKTWKLQIHDDLNKDGNRHNVIHKGSEESIRQRREEKRAKRSEEKKRRIAEKVSNANQRWQKYSNIDDELVLFISRYFDQLPLCSNCRKYFITHRTNILLENPRASIDYAAEDALKLVAKKSSTLKQIAKAKLIRDYDKQTELMFHLCDSCLNKCEEIRNELKQRNVTRKMFKEVSSPNLERKTSTLEKENLPDLHQMYVNNLFQYHQLKLEQLYRKTQHFILNQCNERFSPSITNDREEKDEFQRSIDEMKYHCIESLRLQYPGYSLSFPYLPSSDPNSLSFRHDEKTTNDDRVTIDTCHGLVEYCDAPLDDFIRGLEVLRCLSVYNKCHS